MLGAGVSIKEEQEQEDMEEVFESCVPMKEEAKSSAKDKKGTQQMTEKFDKGPAKGDRDTGIEVVNSFDEPVAQQEVEQFEI